MQTQKAKTLMQPFVFKKWQQTLCLALLGLGGTDLFINHLFRKNVPVTHTLYITG
jgi:hypothetical protein